MELEDWRVTALCVILIVTLPMLLLLPSWLARGLVGGHVVYRPIVAGTIGCGGAILSLVVTARVAGVPAASLFLRPPTRRTIGWSGAGLLLAGILAILTIATTDGTIRLWPEAPIAVAGPLLAGVAIGLWTGTVEELLLRGGVLSLVGHAWSWPGAVVLTAALFGAMHNARGETSLGTGVYIGLTATAGILFALVTLATGNVWNAVGIHAGWNAVFSPHILQFGPATEGMALIQYVPHAGPWFVWDPHWVPTGSPLALALLLVAVAVYAFVRDRRIALAKRD